MESDIVVQHLKRLIVHDAEQYFAIQMGNKYYPADGMLTDADLLDHIAGRKTVGIKLIRPTQQVVKAGAVDLDAASPERTDLQSALEDARRIQRAAADLGLPTAIEFSGRRGWHVWLFSQDAVPASLMRQVLVALVERAGIESAEIFPAGDRISDDGRTGEGSKPIKLPCGLHQVSGTWSGFVGDTVEWDHEDRPILPDQSTLLESIPQIHPLEIMIALDLLSPACQRPIPSNAPDLAKLDMMEPACISWLRLHGAPRDEHYNSTNLTLARYAISRGLGDEDACALASDVARVTHPDHPTSKQEPEEKIRNFRSTLKSARRDPDKYQFECSYILGSTELKTQACSREDCPLWPYQKTESVAVRLEVLLTSTLIEREAIAYLIASPDDGLPLALQRQIPPEAFCTHHGHNGEETRHRIVWDAVLSLAGQEMRQSMILARWEELQAAPVTQEQASWLASLMATPVCSKATFERHLKRLLDVGLRAGLRRSLSSAKESLEHRNDLPEILDTLSLSIDRLQTQGASALVPMVDRTGDLLQNLFTRDRVKIETPSSWLNRVLNGGWLPGRLYVIGAPPGSGKTTFAAWAADFAATDGTPVLFVSYEMSLEQLFTYSLARAGGINSSFIEGQRWKERTGPMTDSLLEKMDMAARNYEESIAPRVTIIEAGPEVTPAYLKGAVGQIRTQAGVGEQTPVLLVIDYLQCMSTGDEALDNGVNETQKASRLATSLKQLARETGAAVIAISDITKAAYQDALKSGKLNMGAFRDSFKISHAADAVLLLQSEPVEVVHKSQFGGNASSQLKSQLLLAQERAGFPSPRGRALVDIENRYPLNSKVNASYAELSILKNRGGRLDGPLFVFERAYHRFTPIDLGENAFEDDMEDDGSFT
jgi:replicative DNA helicase